jgi:hypothetical protein
VQSLRFALFFSSAFINPVGFVFAFLAFFGDRYADATRDLVADELAARTTSNPPALGRALRSLGQHASEGSMLRVGLPRFLNDQFWVMSTRGSARTTVSGMGKTRSWSTADEISLEMTVRAERLGRAGRGDWNGFRGLGTWKAGMHKLGTVVPKNAEAPAQTIDADALRQFVRTARRQAAIRRPVVALPNPGWYHDPAGGGLRW